jgi:hypothetical protein
LPIVQYGKGVMTNNVAMQHINICVNTNYLNLKRIKNENRMLGNNTCRINIDTNDTTSN